MKAMEKVREKQEVAHDEAKFRAEQEALSSQVSERPIRVWKQEPKPCWYSTGIISSTSRGLWCCLGTTEASTHSIGPHTLHTATGSELSLTRSHNLQCAFSSLHQCERAIGHGSCQHSVM